MMTNPWWKGFVHEAYIHVADVIADDQDRAACVAEIFFSPDSGPAQQEDGRDPQRGQAALQGLALEVRVD